MMAEALYRKYRPQVFEDVVGQNAIERTLRNAIDQDKVSHAYLFCGPRGTGKTTTARLLAKALLCQNGPTSTPDGTCEDCELIAAGEHPDVYELDAASRTGVENVREEIIGRVQFAPTRGRRKIYIIDEVHMLSTAAFNALLKTLEEPPSHVVFILCTTDPQKVPETIHSRCQRFDFRRIAHEAIVSRLGAVCMAEGVEFEGEALDLIAHRAEGGMRNALTALEQLIAYEGGKVSLSGAESLLGSIASNDMVRILQAIGDRNAVACFEWVASFIETGADLAQFVRDLAERVRDLYVLSIAGESAALEVNEETRQELVSVLPLFGRDRLSFIMGVLGDTIAELKTSTNPRLTFEIALTRMTRPQTDLTLQALAARIEALEAALRSGNVQVQAAPAQAPAQASTQAARPAADIQTAEPEPVPYERTAPAPAPQEAAPVAAEAPADAPEVTAGAPAPNASRTHRAPYDLTNPAGLQRFWQSALALVKKEKAAYHVLLINTKPIYHADSATLTIGFPSESEFAFKTFQKPEVNEVLERAIEGAYGAPLAFSYVQVSKDATEPSAPQASASAAAPVRTQPVVHEPAPEPQVEAAPAAIAPVAAEPQATADEYEAWASSEEDLVPVDAYEDWAPAQYDDPSESAEPASEPVGQAQADISEADAQKEYDDMKDALSLFGAGVTIEQWQ